MSTRLDPRRPESAVAYLRERIDRGSLVVPPYPTAAMELQRLAADPDVPVRVLAEVVGRDVALAAAVVRHASSAAAGGRAAVLTLEQAVWKLGATELSKLALAVSVGATAVGRGPLAPLRRERWRDSLLAAAFAQTLAARRGLHPDQVFLAGLIHDLGAVVAIAALEEALPHDGALDDAPAWQALVDDAHVEIGLVVADRWQLPEALREVIAYHHAPGACLRVHRPLVTLIQQVDRIIEALAGPHGADALRELPGLDVDEQRQVLALVPKVTELMATFGAALPPIVAPPAPAAPSAPPRSPTWPIDCTVELGRDRSTGRGVWMTTGSLAFEAAAALPLNWLVPVVVVSGAVRCELLANVVACERSQVGHRIVITPFALDGPVKRAWLDLIARARGVAAAS